MQPTGNGKLPEYYDNSNFETTQRNDQMDVEDDIGNSPMDEHDQSNESKKRMSESPQIQAAKRRRIEPNSSQSDFQGNNLALQNHLPPVSNFQFFQYPHFSLPANQPLQMQQPFLAPPQILNYIQSTQHQLIEHLESRMRALLLENVKIYIENYYQWGENSQKAMLDHICKFKNDDLKLLKEFLAKFFQFVDRSNVRNFKLQKGVEVFFDYIFKQSSEFDLKSAIQPIMKLKEITVAAICNLAQVVPTKKIKFNSEMAKDTRDIYVIKKLNCFPNLITTYIQDHELNPFSDILSRIFAFAGIDNIARKFAFHYSLDKSETSLENLTNFPNLTSMRLDNPKILCSIPTEEVGILNKISNVYCHELEIKEEYFSRLTNLKSLSSKYVGKSSEFLSKLTQLKEFKAKISLEMAVKHLSTLSNLKTLELSSQYDKADFNTVLVNLTKLKKLKTDLSVTKSCLSHLTKLSFLDIYPNAQTKNTLLEGVPHLKHLKLTTANYLEIEIGHLTGLTHLDLSNGRYSCFNNLSRYKNSFKNLTNLTFLKMDMGDKLSLDITDTLTNLKSLILYSYSRKKQNSYVEGLENQFGLTCLDLNNFFVSEDSLKNLTNLRHLKVNQKISDASLLHLSKLTSLTIFDVKKIDNKLVTSASLSRLTKLRTLNLSKKYLMKDKLFEGLTNLVNLEANGTKLTEISLSLLTRLHSFNGHHFYQKNLILENNTLDSSMIFRLFENLKQLKINSKFNVEDLNLFTALEVLDFCENNNVEIKHLSKLTNLQTLQLKRNEKAKINPENFYMLRQAFPNTKIKTTS